MTFNFVANIKNGQFSTAFRGNIARYLSTVKDGPYRVTIKRHIKQRTDPQNRYYWGVAIPILSDHTGYTKDEMHEALKWLFLRKRAEGMPDTVKSTAKLTTEEFNLYLDEVKRWAAIEMQVYIPDPNETGE